MTILITGVVRLGARQNRINLSQTKYVFISVTALVTIVLCISSAVMARTSGIYASIEPWIYGCESVDLFFPLVASAPYAWVIYSERKNGFLDYVSTRTNADRYIRGKMISNMLSAFVSVFIIYFFSLVFTLYLMNAHIESGGSRLPLYLFGQVQLQKPLLFGFIWCIYKGAIGAMLCLLGQIISRHSMNLFVITITPLVYTFVENFVTASLGVERFSLTTSFVLNRLTPQVMTVKNMSIGIFVLCIVIFLSSFFMKRKGKIANVTA